MSEKTRWRTIRGIAEETDCKKCGWPLDSGDRALYLYDPSYRGDDPDGDLSGPVYCGTACAARHIGHVERETTIPRY
jgi:hypothetical protein